MFINTSITLSLLLCGWIKLTNRQLCIYNVHSIWIMMQTSLACFILINMCMFNISKWNQLQVSVNSILKWHIWKIFIIQTHFSYSAWWRVSARELYLLLYSTALRAFSLLFLFVSRCKTIQNQHGLNGHWLILPFPCWKRVHAARLKQLMISHMHNTNLHSGKYNSKCTRLIG